MVTRTLACAVAVTGALAAGSGAAQETPARPHYYNPAWSPDGNQLIFESNAEGKDAIYRINFDGTALQRLTAPDASSFQPSWSPDGKRIVFGSTRFGAGQLFLMDADGSKVVRLTNTTTGSHFLPSFSPDGRWVTFGVQFVVRRDVYYVAVVRADGSQMRLLTDSTSSNEGPHWSRDGRRVEFTRVALVQRREGEPVKDFIKRRASTEQTMAIGPQDSVSSPIVRDSIVGRSADGTTLYFVSRRSGELAGFAMNADGTTVRRLGGAEVVNSISQDGRWSAYTKQIDGWDALFIMELATGRERLLVGGPPPPGRG